MKTYYFNNSKYFFSKGQSFIVIGEAAFRKIQDNFLCGTQNGSWNDHWLETDAENLEAAKAKFRKLW